MHDAEPQPRHRPDPPCSVSAVELRAIVVTCEHEGEQEQDAADREDDDEARPGPVWKVRRNKHPDDEQRARDHVECAVGEHRSDERRPRAAQPWHVAREHSNAR
jgi:hypothetical protein